MTETLESGVLYIQDDMLAAIETLMGEYPQERIYVVADELSRMGIIPEYGMEDFPERILTKENLEAIVNNNQRKYDAIVIAPVYCEWQDTTCDVVESYLRNAGYDGKIIIEGAAETIPNVPYHQDTVILTMGSETTRDNMSPHLSKVRAELPVYN